MPQKTFSQLATEYPELAEWLNTNEREFSDALGCWGPKETILLALAQLPGFLGGSFRGYKNDIDRRRCDVLRAFLRGDQADEGEVKTAIVLLIQSFNAACERLHYLERATHQPAPRHIYPKLPHAIR